MGKSISDLPNKYKENFEAMQDFADILEIAEPGSDDYQEAKAEWEDYDEQILKALKRDYPAAKPAKKKPAPRAASKPAQGAKKPKRDITGMPPVDENGERRIDDAALDALEAHIDTLPQTKKMHSKDGEYTAKRKNLHDKIITEEIEGNACIRRDAPIAILTGGLPGSGKSTYIRNNKDWMTNPAIFKIDADDIRAKLPEYKGWNASQTHSETQDLVKNLLNKVGKFGCSYDVIYDGTMNKSKKYKPLIDTLKKEGYRVFIMFLKVDKATSLERAMGRYKKSGRYVPRFVIQEGVENGLTAFNELKGIVDGYVLIDGKTQKLIEKGGSEIPDDRDYDKLSSEAKGKKSGKAAKNYSWKKASDVSSLKPITLHCQHYHLLVKESVEVSLKGTGNASRKVTAKPGEHIIFDDQGYPVYIMNASSFAKKCNEERSVAEHKAKLHGSCEPKDEKIPAKLSKYKGVFGDFDGDGILNVDDPNPYVPGDGKTTVEEVKLSDELEKIIDFRKSYDQSREEFVEILRKSAEGESDILSRTKTPYSIINKLRRKRLVGKKGLTDVIGTMVVFPDQKSLEAFKDKVNAGKLGEVLEFDDYYKKPQAGYRAYHWNVVYKGSPVEIQAKTERIKKIAGANHTLYKEGKDDAEKLGALMLLAMQADKGDTKAAKTIDAILADKAETMKYLTEKKVSVSSNVATKSASNSKPATKKKASAPKKKTESKPAKSRRSPMAVVDAEIRDIRNAQKKPMSADDREKYKKEYADLEKKKDNKSYLGYIKKQLKAAEKDGVKLSEAQVKKLGIMIQPLIQNPSGAFLDILSSNKKRLKPTYENLLRWTESPGRYDLIGVDTANTKATVKARKPESPAIFDLLGL